MSASLPDATIELPREIAEAAFAAMLDGDFTDEDIARFLTEMADRGESAIEIAAAAGAMRERMIPIAAPDNAIDVCGTGGDGQHSLNVSTAVALVVAAAGVPVAKHGNRAASSQSGAADTLEALGLDLKRASETAETTLADLGICFLFAQAHHPALARLAPIRKALGRRTIFNLLGPLANPARVRRQLIGIARPALVKTYAKAVLRLDMEKVLVVSGDEGLDELSIAGSSTMARIDAQGIYIHHGNPLEAGLPLHDLGDIRGGDPQFNAEALKKLLQGEHGAYRDAVLLNAAAALIVAGEVETLKEGVEEAAETIDKGLAKALLDCWIAF